MRQQARILFARLVGMDRYDGTSTARVVSGTRCIREGGQAAENCNFRDEGGKVYGHVEAPEGLDGKCVNLARIVPGARGEFVDRVLVVFVAPRRKGKQTVVGWYRNARVYARGQSVPRNCRVGRNKNHYYAEADTRNCVLLAERQRRWLVPTGAGGMTQTCVRYTYLPDGRRKLLPWMLRVLNRIEHYRGPSVPPDQDDPPLGETPEARMAGYEPDSSKRKLIEQRAMKAAKKLLRAEGFTGIRDTHAGHCYDFICRKGSALIYVEVKGTATSGEKVILTRNEVEHANRKKPALVIVHSIDVRGGTAKGGECRLFKNWTPRRKDLTALYYSYAVD